METEAVELIVGIKEKRGGHLKVKVLSFLPHSLDSKEDSRV